MARLLDVWYLNALHKIVIYIHFIFMKSKFIVRYHQAKLPYFCKLPKTRLIFKNINFQFNLNLNDNTM